MAQANKSRVVIWTIVGILVVVAVIFLIVAKKGAATTGARSFTEEDVPKFVSTMTSRVEKFERRLARIRDEYGPEAAEAFARIEENLGKVRTGLLEIQELTDVKALAEKRDEVKQDYSSAKDVFKEFE